MSDLISRSALIKMLDECVDTVEKQENKSLLFAFGEFIKSAPAIDAVPVVRCKDCKHLEKEKRQNGETDLFCGLTDLYANPDGYCECGERQDIPSI